MNITTMKAWANQFSTIIGALVATPTFAALLMHQMTWEQAAPLLIGSAVGLLYPENKTAATSAQTTVTDAEVLIPQLLTAYRTGLTHGVAAVTPVAPAPLPAAVIASIAPAAVPAPVA